MATKIEKKNAKSFLTDSFIWFSAYCQQWQKHIGMLRQSSFFFCFEQKFNFRLLNTRYVISPITVGFSECLAWHHLQRRSPSKVILWVHRPFEWPIVNVAVGHVSCPISTQFSPINPLIPKLNTELRLQVWWMLFLKFDLYICRVAKIDVHDVLGTITISIVFVFDLIFSVVSSSLNFVRSTFFRFQKIFSSYVLIEWTNDTVLAWLNSLETGIYVECLLVYYV